MKRILVLLILIPSVAFGAFTEFYCSPTATGNSNINAGSTTGAAAKTWTNMNWSTSTNKYTITNGDNPSTFVAVNDWVSIYNDGATSAVFIARVTAVDNLSNGAITVSSTSRAGAAPTTSTTARSLTAGGVWTGPNAAISTPLNLATFNNATNANGDPPCINMKNDASYSCTGQILISGAQCLVQGYSSTVRDGGKAVITNSVNNANPAYNLSASNAEFADIIFAETATLNANPMISGNGAAVLFHRCVFHGARGSGVVSNLWTLDECEAYDNNKSNTANKGSFEAIASSVFKYCYVHDNASGSNAHGWATNTSTVGTISLDNCIADTNAGNGLDMGSATTNTTVSVVNSDFYNNTGDGIHSAAAAGTTKVVVKNSGFFKNSGKGINIANTTYGQQYNCVYGAGTQANGSSDSVPGLSVTGNSTYTSNATPYNAPSTGDFSIVGAPVQGTGRGHFEENDGTNTGTVGYPDIGAAQANIGVAFPTPSPTATATATPTSTPIPTSQGVAY